MCIRDSLVPYRSRNWNKLTAWRNVAEGRNATLQNKGLKRFPDYGLRHVTFLVIGADIVENLCTLARLVYEAACADDRFQAQPGRHPRHRVLLRTSPATSPADEPVIWAEVVEIG